MDRKNSELLRDEKTESRIWSVLSILREVNQRRALETALRRPLELSSGKRSFA